MSSEFPNMDVVDSPSGLRFIHIDYPSDCHMPLHAHDGAASLIYCLAGTATERRDRENLVLSPSTLSLVPAGLPHSNQFSAGHSAFLVVVEQPWLSRIRQVSGILDTPLARNEGRANGTAGRMYREFLRRDSLTPLVLEGILSELVADLARTKAPPAGRDAPGWLSDALDYLHAHFLDDVTSEAVAAACCVHPSHLMRTFRRCQGGTIGEYVRGLRIDHARRLLEATDIPLGELALDSGFCDQGHFTRAFKARTGISPGEFRKSRRDASLVQRTQH
jgi:AraC family transcriptional regulator